VKLKVGHVSDAHFQNTKLLPGIIRCGDFIVQRMEKEEPDLICVAGDTLDFYKGDIQLGSPAARAATDFVFRLAQIAPLAVVRGTVNHDGTDSLLDFERLKTRFPIRVSDKLEQVLWCPDDGFIVLRSTDKGYCCERAKAIISFLPAVNKAGLLAAGTDGGVDDTNRETENLLRDVIAGWGIRNAQATTDGLVPILVAHLTVIGSRFSSGQVAIGREIEASLGDLMLGNFRLGCLGHVHASQEWQGPGWWIGYSGSIERLDYAEMESKGVYIHELSTNDNAIISTFFETPARQMRTLRAEGLPDASVMADVQPGENVRLVYEIGEEEIGAVDEAELKRIALEKGAASVTVEHTTRPIVRVRAANISKETTNMGRLAMWAQATGVEITEGPVSKLALIEEAETGAIIGGYENLSPKP